MDRRTLAAITLSFLILLGWQKLYLEPQQRAMNAQTSAAPSAAVQTNAPVATAPVTTTAAIQTAAAVAPPVARPAQTATLKTSLGEAQVGDGHALFTGWSLSGYRLGIDKEAASVDLHSVTHKAGSVELAFDSPALGYLAQAQGTLQAVNANQASWRYEDANVVLAREFKSSEKNAAVEVLLSAQFKTTPPRYAFVSIASEGFEGDPEVQDRQLIAWEHDSLTRFPLDKANELKEIPAPVKYIGATSHYFLMSVLSDFPVDPKALIQPLGVNHSRVALVYPITGNSISIPLRAYFGPKEITALRAVDPKLDHTVDFGWFTLIAYPLLRLLKWLYELVHNYGVAIICLTILVRMGTYPLTYKSMKSMKEMARLQPQLQKLKERYANDKEALNREMITLMRSHGYNPMAGCLPMLVQMPIFLALYRVLYSSIELYHAPFYFWIHDLSLKDPFYITPVLLTCVMYIQQRLTPSTATDPMQQKMLQFMPLIFGVFMISLPSGLTLYMLTSAIVGIFQQMVLNKKLHIVPHAGAKA